MKVIVEGHRYELENFEDKDRDGQILQFIHKDKGVDTNDPTKLVTVDDGTTNEEVLAVLIDRLNYLNGKFPCPENSIAIRKLREGLFWLNERTRERVARQVEGKNLA